MLVTWVKATANLILLHIISININQAAAKAVKTQKNALFVVSPSASFCSSSFANNLKYTANTTNPASTINIKKKVINPAQHLKKRK